MKRFHMFVSMYVLSVMMLGVLFAPNALWACACGCGVFEVGTNSMIPTHPGGMIYTEYDYLNQDRNWSGTSPSNADNNPDKKLVSDFFSISAQYMFNRSWGIDGELPFTDRFFKTTEDDGQVEGFTHSAMGDIRIRGIYSGFSPSMASGLTFGIRLPTGDYTYPNFDPDTEIGSGSTDLLLGGYHMGEIPNSNWNWFLTGEGDQPMLHYSGYSPGTEIDAVVGGYYDGWNVGAIKIAPLGEIVGSYRWSDSGTLADAPDSGFKRILLTPGIEIDTQRFKIYADVGFPVYQSMNGNQMVASEYYKLNIGYHF